ncbi:MAG TPA: hypothetical protein VEI25_02385 [Paraburkholderia sp.]|nr:hypothetical protein [Paraburkholderia sp.]
MRAVVAAMVVGLFSSAAMAAGQYVEVWNPPEASHHPVQVKKKNVATGAARHAAAPVAKKPAQTSTKVASKAQHEKLAPRRVAGANAASKEALHGKPKVQVLAGKNSQPKAATKVGAGASVASNVTTRPATPTRELPPILR